MPVVKEPFISFDIDNSYVSFLKPFIFESPCHTHKSKPKTMKTPAPTNNNTKTSTTMMNVIMSHLTSAHSVLIVIEFLKNLHQCKPAL